MTNFGPPRFGFGDDPDWVRDAHYGEPCPDCGRTDCPRQFLKRMLDGMSDFRQNLPFEPSPEGRVSLPSAPGAPGAPGTGVTEVHVVSAVVDEAVLREERRAEMGNLGDAVLGLERFWLEHGKDVPITGMLTAVRLSDWRAWHFSLRGGDDLSEIVSDLAVACAIVATQQPDYVLVSGEGERLPMSLHLWSGLSPAKRHAYVERLKEAKAAPVRAAMFWGEDKQGRVITIEHDVKVDPILGTRTFSNRQLLDTALGQPAFYPLSGSVYNPERAGIVMGETMMTSLKTGTAMRMDGGLRGRVASRVN